MVEWKKLGEVCEIGTGSNNREDCCENGLYPFFVRSKEVLRINSYLFDEEAILIPGEGGIGDIFHYINGKYGLHQRAYRVHPINDGIKGKYIYYFLFEYFKSYIDKKSYKSTATSIRKPMLLDFPIPIPSKPEQERIVKILDTFTDSIANLKAQIDARRKQYEYYRDQLLDLEGKEGVEMKTLPQISKNLDSKRKPITSSNRKPGPYPYYGASGIVDYVEGYIFEGSYLLISEDGANLVARNTPIAFKIEGKNWVNNHAHVISFDDDATLKYVEIYLNKIDLSPWINGAAQPKLNQDNLNRILIPLPSLEEQSRIVGILDQFEAIIANLEAQLKAREKQYEYYRNKLLTFE